MTLYISDPVKNTMQFSIYCTLLRSMPTLHTQVKWALENDIPALNKLGHFVSLHSHTLIPLFCWSSSKLDMTASKGCSNSYELLPESSLKYIPHLSEITLLKANAKKDQCGFHHHLTACLLCPWHLRDKFNKDRDKFYTNMQNGMWIITHKSWPLFLYPEDGYYLEEINKNLLCPIFTCSELVRIL